MHKVLAENVRSLRKAKKLSQNALAERASLSLRGIQEIEYENAWPEIATVESLARALDVPQSRLFYDSELKPDPEECITILSEFIQSVKNK